MHMHTVTRHGLHDIHGQLEKIRKVFEKWGWSGGRVLVVMSPEASRQESQRMTEAMEERERQREAKDES